MDTIAKGEITLGMVNDAYTVSLTPASCIIKADFDGSNPQLEDAQSVITVKRGSKDIPFRILDINKSSADTNVSLPFQQGTSIPFLLTSVGNKDLQGYIDFEIKTEDGFNYTTKVRFAFSIVRESTMLDWIQDWEGSKTKIGGTYIMTPKIFIGKKEDIVTEANGQLEWVSGALTGVYIGPDLLGSNESSVGIYGYHKSQEIFHLNSNGGFMGGWSFDNDGLYSANGVVSILAEGTIFAQSPNSTKAFWGLYADGSASFANGNVKFQSDGSAEYSGKITSTSGTIGGWEINSHQITNGRVIIDSNKHFIGIDATSVLMSNMITGEPVFPPTPTGGVKMWYTSANDFGFAGWASKHKVFQLGSTNFIAGWNFNHEAIWAGTEAPSLTQGAYTQDEGSLTLSPNGIRSYKWYIDADGTASYVGGKVKFNTENAEMFGWLMRHERFSSKHAALVSSSSHSGLFVSTTDISEVNSGSLLTTIQKNGGICVISNGNASIVRAYDTNGKLGFVLSTSGTNSIGKWNFNHEVIYTGTQGLGENGFTASKSIVLGISGLFGPTWRLQADGSGAIAGGNISWTEDGKVTFSEQVTLSWNSVTGGPNLSHIDKDGLYTGTISANKITAGTISTASIQAEGKWKLNTDGSGYLACNNLFWGPSGNLSIKGHIEATSGLIGGFEISENCIGFDRSKITSDTPQAEWASLCLCKDFFRVGGSGGYVMFSDDVYPSSVATTYRATAVGRIVNNAVALTDDPYLPKQCNYGLLLEVSGGDKNYGIDSNSPIIAPSFINTEVALVNLDDSWSMDLSQHNIFLIYASKSKSIALPDESYIAQCFGKDKIADDFGLVLTIKVRKGSKPITINGLYRLSNGLWTSASIILGEHYSIQILVSKADGLRYDVLSITNT